MNFKPLSAILLLTGMAYGQSTTVQNLGTIPVFYLLNGFGTNIGTSQEEFVAAAAMGVKTVRIGSCGWANAEGQSAPPSNTSTGLSLPTACSQQVTWAAQNGMTPILEALYGPPAHTILNVTVATTASIGATSITLNLTSGVGGDTFSNVAYPYDYLALGSTPIAANQSYDGDLIGSITIISGSQATVTVTSALTQALTAGTAMQVNEILYPSPVTGHYASEPSTQAYLTYARYLNSAGNAITSAYGIPTIVSLWNEPPWTSEFWDNRTDGYDTNPGLPGNMGTSSANFGFADGIQAGSALSGQTYIWDGTDKTGANTLVPWSSSRMLSISGHNLTQPTTGGMNAESYHPYGTNPEGFMWNQPALVANTSLGSATCLIPSYCGNYYQAEQITLNARAAGGSTYGIKHYITETGYSTAVANGNGGTETQKARYNMRQWLGGIQEDLQSVVFYRLYDNSDAVNGTTAFSWVTLTTGGTPCGNSCSGANGYTALPTFTAAAGIMSDLAPLNNATVEAINAPAVASYSGTYQLAQSNFAGARAGAAHNSYAVTLWQVSAVTSGQWSALTSPSAGSVVMAIPTNYKIYAAIDTVTRSSVSVSISGSTATIPVADNPVELIFDPLTTANLSLGNVIVRGSVIVQ